MQYRGELEQVLLRVRSVSYEYIHNTSYTFRTIRSNRQQIHVVYVRVMVTNYELLRNYS